MCWRNRLLNTKFKIITFFDGIVKIYQYIMWLITLLSTNLFFNNYIMRAVIKNEKNIYRHMANKFWWKNLPSKVKVYIQICQECQWCDFPTWRSFASNLGWSFKTKSRPWRRLYAFFLGFLILICCLLWSIRLSGDKTLTHFFSLGSCSFSVGKHDLLIRLFWKTCNKRGFESKEVVES